MSSLNTDVGLDRAALDRAFPFHFRLSPRGGSWGVVAEIGSQLGRIAPNAMVGRALDDAFVIVRPGEGIDVRKGPDSNQAYLLRPTGRNDALLLRGQFLPVARGASMVFIGAPWVGELDDLHKFGLSLHDFPPHESLGDMLLLLQTRTIALRDLRELNAKLTSTARNLDEKNRQLNDALDRRQRLEARLRQVQKMEAIGQLAGGIAHDFNNLMTAILGYSALAMQTLTKDHEAWEFIHEIEKATSRATALTSQLLAFSRRNVVQPKVFDLAAECREAESLLRRLLGERFRLVASYSAEPTFVEADPNSLQQVIMNLVTNARDAMPEGGEVHLRTARVGVDTVEPPVTGVYGVLLEVSDSGSGMPPEMLERIFEPFFTTKPVGKGTGLGLSTVYGIVQQAGGEVTVESKVGAGTTFRVWLPAREPVSPAGESNQDSSRPRIAAAVLLVEDEPAVQTLFSQVLAKAGFRIRAAGDPVAALAAAKEMDRIDVLVTDVGLPGMSGPDLADAIRSLHPEVRALFISGYAESEAIRDRLSTGIDQFLQKPFHPSDLVDRIVELVVRTGAVPDLKERP